MRRPQLTPLIAAGCAGFAAWCSIGSLAVAEADTAARFGFLPPWWLLPVLVAGFATMAPMVRLSAPTALPLFFSLVLVLPWIPGPIPAAFLLWTGRLVPVVWLAVIIGMLAARKGRGRGRGSDPMTKIVIGSDPLPLAPLAAAAVAFCVYLFAGHHLAGIRVPGGDEPHYLVIAQSLLKDGDIRIENNHARGDYREYFNPLAPLRPHYLRRGANGEIYSIHAPGLPAVVAPAYAMFGYPGVVALLSLIAAIGSALLWQASYVLTGSASAAWFGWAAGSLTVPFVFQAFSVYPDGLGATLVLFAVLPLVEERVGTVRWIAIGAALALLPWLHTRFSVLAAAVAAVLLLRLLSSAEGRARILPFLVLPAASALGWFGFFSVVYGTFNPAVPYGGDTQSHPVNIVNGLPALLFDQQFGILPNAPVYFFCLVGMVALARSRRRLAIELAAVAAAYLLSSSAFYMWWGGSSSPARFAVPVLPVLALPGAWLWKTTARPSARAMGVVALLLSAAITVAFITVDQGRLAYNDRDGYSRAAEWVSPLVDLSRGLPSFFRQTPVEALLRVGIWIAALLSAVVGLRTIERKDARRAVLALATPTSLALAAMAALTAVWALDRVAAALPQLSQLHLLGDYDPRLRPAGISLRPLQLTSADAMLSRITLETPTHRQPGSDRTLLVVPGIVPGGLYELRRRGSASTGEAALVIGRNASPVKVWNIEADFRDGSAELELPVNVGSLVIEGAGTGGATLTLHPKQLWSGSARLASTSAYARRAQRYGPAIVYFFDAGAFPEATGIWIRGGSAAEIAVAPERREVPLQLFVRNAPVANNVTLEVDSQTQTRELKPGEEMLVPIPIAADRPGARLRLRTGTGFRPSEVEPGSTDTRFLGVWVELR